MMGDQNTRAGHHEEEEIKMTRVTPRPQVTRGQLVAYIIAVTCGAETVRGVALLPRVEYVNTRHC